MKSDSGELFDILAEILETSHSKIESIRLDDDLSNYGLDSCKALQFFAAAEDEYNIKFNYDDLRIENVNTIDKIKAFLNRYLS